VKAPAFGYARPESVEAALGLLEEWGERATILAGGQSLLASLNLRLSQPEILIDIGRLDHLRGIEDAGSVLRVGALTRHVDILNAPQIAQSVPLVAMAMPHVAHVAVRNRGTFGGSVALADPAAELPACCVALGATFHLKSAGGERKVAAETFFDGLYSTVRQANELLVAIELPKRPGWRFAFHELTRRHGDFAMAGVAAAWGDGALRLVVFGCEAYPRVASHAAQAAAGHDLADPAVRDAVINALDSDLDPMANLQGRADTKLRWAKVLAGKALADLAGKEQP
jgi:carbon-monoxide dehydrogenase medium subunit